MSVSAEDLRTILTRPIAFHRMFATVGGSVGAGVFLSQLYYWSERTDDPDGWVYKTAEDWYDETMLGRHELDTVRKALKRKGIIEEKLRGVPATTNYRIKWDDLFESLKEAARDHRERVDKRRLNQFAGKRQTEGRPQIAGKRQTSLPESDKLDSFKAANQFAEKCQTTNRSETSSEITPENTTTTTPRAKAKVVDPVEPPVVVVASLEASEEAEPTITAEELAELVDGLGISRHQIKNEVMACVKSHGLGYLKEKIAIVESEPRRNKAVCLLKALREDWQPSIASQQIQEERERKRHKEERERQDQAERDAKERERARREQEQQAFIDRIRPGILDRWNAATPEQRRKWLEDYPCKKPKEGEEPVAMAFWHVWPKIDRESYAAYFEAFPPQEAAA
jgi:hypothetical protein